MLSCWRCSVSEAGQSASFCQARYFLCDWLCERWRKREAMIRQRSHVTARQSEHKLCSPLLCHPVSSTFSCWWLCALFVVVVVKIRKMIGLFNQRLVCVPLFAHIHCDEKFAATDTDMKECYSLRSERCGQTYISLQVGTPVIFFSFFSTAPFLFFFLLHIHLHSMIITIIYTGHCWNANPT